MKAQLAALVSAAATILVVVAATYFVVGNAAMLNGSTVIPGFLDIAFHYNRGISFGLFAQDTEMGSRLLILGLALLIGGLALLAYRTTQTLVGIGLGLVIGGALVNLLDRAIDGAVFDYLEVHLGSVPLFVCNAPDIAISLGFLVWLASEFFSESPVEKPGAG